MTQPTPDRRQCPTRLDGSDTLIAHLITNGTCSERQAKNYHKCSTCRFGCEEGALELALAPLPKPNKKEPAVAPAKQAV